MQVLPTIQKFISNGWIPNLSAPTMSRKFSEMLMVFLFPAALATGALKVKSLPSSMPAKTMFRFSALPRHADGYR